MMTVSGACGMLTGTSCSEVLSSASIDPSCSEVLSSASIDP